MTSKKKNKAEANKVVAPAKPVYANVDDLPLVARNEVKRILADPLIQLLLLIARSFNGQVTVPNMETLNHRLVRQPPLTALMRHLQMLQKYGLVEWRKNGKSIEITTPYKLPLAIESAVMQP